MCRSPAGQSARRRVRDSVAFTEYFALRVGREETPAKVIRYCETMAADFDASTFEGKLGVLDVETEMTMLADLASALGPGKIARVDANGVYTVPTARRVVRTLAASASAGSKIRAERSTTPARTARRRPSRVVLHPSARSRRAARSGRPRRVLHRRRPSSRHPPNAGLPPVLRRAGIDFWCYSGDAGIVTAAYLHLTAAEPSMIHPHQSLFRFTADVVIEQGHYAPEAASSQSPTNPVSASPSTTLRSAG